VKKRQATFGGGAGVREILVASLHRAEKEKIKSGPKAAFYLMPAATLT
jgi:hypothetical protein